MSFDARFDGNFEEIGESDDPSTVSACLKHNNMVFIGDCDSSSQCTNDSSISCTDDLDGDGRDFECDVAVSRQDCWSEGRSSADIVFIMDTSSSTSTYLENTRTSIPNLVAELERREIAAKYAVIDMDSDGSSAMTTLELQVTSDVEDISNTFDSDSSVCSGVDFYNTGVSWRNDDPCLNSSGASVDPYAAIADVLENNIQAYNSNSEGGTLSSADLAMRGSALPIIILVTDTGDEYSSNIYDEAYVLDLFYETEAIIIAVTPDTLYSSYGDAASYYSGITSVSGGEVITAINDADWTADGSVIDSLVTIIEEEVDQFQFDNIMQNYALGPITLDNRSLEDGELGAAEGKLITSELELRASDNSVFQIDNVSLKPVLLASQEVEVDPIGRTCRAWPASDSLQCEYTDTSGAQYQGWRGYCLESDPFNRRRCITWWPLDYLSGEASITKRESAGYDGRTELQYCLVAKGYEDPGFCDQAEWDDSGDTITYGDGQICTDDSQCSSGTCVKSVRHTVDDPTSSSSKPNFSTPLTTNAPEDGYTYRMRWQTNDPNAMEHGTLYEQYLANGFDLDDLVESFFLSPFTLLDSSDDIKVDAATVVRLPASEVLRNVHVSEIESIIFNTGSAGFGDESVSNGPEWTYWGQLGKTGDTGLTGATADVTETYVDGDGNAINPEDNDNECGTNGFDCNKYGNWVISDFAEGSINQNDDGSQKPWEDCYAYRANDGLDIDTMGIGCRVWGAYDSNYELDYYDDAENFDYYDTSGNSTEMDIVYTWAWSNFDYGLGTADDADATDYNCNTGSSTNEDKYPYRWENLEDREDLWFDSPCIGDAVKQVMGVEGSGSQNPWKRLGNADNLNNCIESYEGEFSSEEVKICVEEDPGDNWSAWTSWTERLAIEDEDWGAFEQHSSGGNNIFSLWIDVNSDGYISAVYYLIYTGAMGTYDFATSVDAANFNLTFDNDMSLDFQLRESCALVVEAVDSSGDNVAWAERASTGSDYNMDHAADDSGYEYSTEYDTYGAIAPIPSTDSIFLYDTLLEAPDNIYKWGSYSYQPFVFVDYADTFTAGRPLSCIGECEQKWCVSDFGEGSFYDQGDGICSTSDDCSDGGVCVGVGREEISGEGLSSVSSYEDQIVQTAVAGRDRLKHVFADVVGSYYRPAYRVDSASRMYNTDTIYGADGYWLNDPTDSSSGNIFDDMVVCDGNERDDNDKGLDAEYCGVRPVIDDPEDPIAFDDQTAYTENKYTITNGKTVTLSFTSDVDPEQKPLKSIYIDWGDGKTTSDPWDADTTTHYYTHSYQCGPEYQQYTEEYSAADGGTCVYKPKITVVDNWLWCSGNITDATALPTSGNQYRSAENVGNALESCNSWDTPNFDIEVVSGSGSS